MLLDECQSSDVCDLDPHRIMPKLLTVDTRLRGVPIWAGNWHLRPESPGLATEPLSQKDSFKSALFEPLHYSLQPLSQIYQGGIQWATHQPIEFAMIGTTPRYYSICPLTKYTPLPAVGYCLCKLGLVCWENSCCYSRQPRELSSPFSEIWYTVGHHWWLFTADSTVQWMGKKLNLSFAYLIGHPLYF